MQSNHFLSQKPSARINSVLAETNLLAECFTLNHVLNLHGLDPKQITYKMKKKCIFSLVSNFQNQDIRIWLKTPIFKVFFLELIQLMHNTHCAQLSCLVQWAICWVRKMRKDGSHAMLLHEERALGGQGWKMRQLHDTPSPTVSATSGYQCPTMSTSLFESTKSSMTWFSNNVFAFIQTLKLNDFLCVCVNY